MLVHKVRMLMANKCKQSLQVSRSISDVLQHDLMCLQADFLSTTTKKKRHLLPVTSGAVSTSADKSQISAYLLFGSVGRLLLLAGFKLHRLLASPHFHRGGLALLFLHLLVVVVMHDEEIDAGHQHHHSAGVVHVFVVPENVHHGS